MGDIIYSNKEGGFFMRFDAHTLIRNAHTVYDKHDAKKQTRVEGYEIERNIFQNAECVVTKIEHTEVEILVGHVINNGKHDIEHPLPYQKHGAYNQPNKITLNKQYDTAKENK